MLDTLIHTSVPAGWESVDDDPESLVGRHESGTTLYVWETQDLWLANIVQRVECDGYTADVTTHAADFSENQELVAYLTSILESIESGEDIVDAIAIIGHDGTTESIDTSGDGPLIDPDVTPELADVFTVYPERLPKGTTVDDVVDARDDLIGVIYGDIRPSESDGFQLLNNEREAYDSLSLEVFSVSEYSLSRVDAADDTVAD